MKAERIELKQEFVPVIVTLESQEEVDSLFVLANHPDVTRILPATDNWWGELSPFASSKKRDLYDELNTIIR